MIAPYLRQKQMAEEARLAAEVHQVIFLELIHICIQYKMMMIILIVNISK